MTISINNLIQSIAEFRVLNTFIIEELVKGIFLENYLGKDISICFTLVLTGYK